MSDGMMEAHWIELVGGPLCGTCVEWQGAVGDKKAFKYVYKPCEDVTGDDIDALKRGLPESPRGWAGGYRDVISADRGSPKGVAVYALLSATSAIYEYTQK